MSKRKLNRRQAWRAEKIQADRLKRTEGANRDLSRQTQSSDLSSEQLGLVICRYSKHFEVEALEGDDIGNVHRCVARANLGSIVAGDIVVWKAGTDQTGVIESRKPRESILERPDNFGQLKPVAANIDQMLIVVAPEPSPQDNLIDRYIVAAELMNINAVLIMNKADLVSRTNQDQLESLLALYQKLGYATERIISSRHQSPALANLPDIVNNRTSIVVGQSGVGKSSLINALLPEANLEVGELSSATREGTHTTTKAKLFHLPGGGQLIDSPGIRDFSLWHIDSDQLQFGFIEIAKHVGACRFRDCKHENEPGCGIHAAVKAGEISESRFASFERIKHAIAEQNARGLNS